MTDVIAKRRVKKSYSISVEAEGFVRKVRKARKIASDSEALDMLLRELIEVHRKSAVDAAYKAYYDSASDQELEDEKSWAEFGTAQMAELSQ
ncbi:MAG TPA: hypothetical protein VFC39_23075 [Acidobacteriaceae bacterium]|nr:hypothetical protein [Acidobacteriaceae bacterium]